MGNRIHVDPREALMKGGPHRTNREIMTAEQVDSFFDELDSIELDELDNVDPFADTVVDPFAETMPFYDDISMASTATTIPVPNSSGAKKAKKKGLFSSGVIAGGDFGVTQEEMDSIVNLFPYDSNKGKQRTSLESMSTAELDQMLKKHEKESKIAGLVTIVGIVLTFAVFMLGNKALPPSMYTFACILSLLIAAVGGIAMLISSKKNRVDEIAKVAMRMALSDSFSNVQIAKVIPHKKKKTLDAMLSNIYNMKNGNHYNEFDASDLVWGTSENGVAFEFADLYARNVTKRNNTRHVETRFKGQYIRFATNKTLESALVIRRKGAGEARREKDGGIVTDNPEFNKRWHVVSDNATDALYILTPNFMERLEEFETNISRQLGATGKTDYIFGADGTVTVFVYTSKNLFELYGDVDGKTRKFEDAKMKSFDELVALYDKQTKWIRVLMDNVGFGEL